MKRNDLILLESPQSGLNENLIFVHLVVDFLII